MQLHFNSIYELMPGVKWQNLFDEKWPAYSTWLNSNKTWKAVDTNTSIKALKEYMPEMVNIHQKLCHLVNAGEEATHFLTGFQPPPYYSACSQAVTINDKIQLIRNYDYHPDQIEGTLLFSSWNGKKVIVNSESLIGAIDGMNDDGLAVSLTFGGRKAVGFGFGIPFILRYILEFCSTVKEATEVLIRVPSHMSYNVTVLDRSGDYSTIQIAPDRSALVTKATFATNHQNVIEWEENASFNKTLEREAFLKRIILNKDMTSDALVNSFLEPPLYTNLFSEGLGTLYTAIYSPVEGTVQLRWPDEYMLQSINHFIEESKLITFDQRQKPPKHEMKKSKSIYFK